MYYVCDDVFKPKSKLYRGQLINFGRVSITITKVCGIIRMLFHDEKCCAHFMRFFYTGMKTIYFHRI